MRKDRKRWTPLGAIRDRIAARKLTKEYWKELKGIQDSYFSSGILEKRHPNRQWKREWKRMLSQNFDWDYFYIIHILVYKIQKMRLYIEKFGLNADPNPIYESMDKAISLGKYLLEHDRLDFFAEADEFIKKHTKVVVRFNKDLPIEKGSNLMERMKAIGGGELVAEKELDDFDFMAIMSLRKELGIPDKGVSMSHTRFWDDEKNREKYHQILEECDKRWKDMIKEFFMTIAENLTSWWD